MNKLFNPILCRCFASRTNPGRIRTIALPKLWETVPDEGVINELTYRVPKEVFYSTVYLDGCEFPICPACATTMEREYMSYCDRCGQALDWNSYDHRIAFGPRGTQLPDSYFQDYDEN